MAGRGWWLCLALAVVGCGAQEAELSEPSGELGESESELSTSPDYDHDGYATVDGDCDDTRAERSPGAPELPANFVDDDCDRSIDEGCNDPIVGDPSTTICSSSHMPYSAPQIKEPTSIARPTIRLIENSLVYTG